MDDDFDDYGSDISLYEESDEESDGGNYQDLNPTYLWTVQNSDRFEFPHDIEPFEESSGPVNPPVRTSEPLEYFQWLSSDDNISIIDILVEETNRYAHQIRNSNNLKPNSRLKKWEDVSHEEMSAFLGLWLSMGILRKPTMASYWYESQQTWLYNTPTFTKIMRRDRFQIILQCLHANNNAGALPRGNPNHDPAHKVRRIFDLINKVFKEKYAAARDLTVDESMVGHKGRDYTVQYMPAKKAHRWGAKLWVLAESDTGYTLSIDLYAGMYL